MNTQELYDYCHEYFSYEDGKLFWKKRKQKINIGDEAGSTRKDGYRVVSINYSRQLSHRMIYLMHYNDLPKYIDHIDGNPRNAKIDNLRPCTHQQNLCNRGPIKSNKVGYKGVYIDKRYMSFVVNIKVASKTKNMGSFKCQHAAARKYNTAARMHQGHQFCYTNKVAECNCEECV